MGPKVLHQPRKVPLLPTPRPGRNPARFVPVLLAGAEPWRVDAGSRFGVADPRTCLLTVNQHGTYTRLSGTGKYAKISGHGTYQVNILAIDARPQGRCAQREPPVALQLIIRASGPASL